MPFLSLPTHTAEIQLSQPCCDGADDVPGHGLASIMIWSNNYSWGNGSEKQLYSYFAGYATPLEPSLGCCWWWWWLVVWLHTLLSDFMK